MAEYCLIYIQVFHILSIFCFSLRGGGHMLGSHLTRQWLEMLKIDQSNPINCKLLKLAVDGTSSKPLIIIIFYHWAPLEEVLVLGVLQHWKVSPRKVSTV